jgi:hypothetical protein
VIASHVHRFDGGPAWDATTMEHGGTMRDRTAWGLAALLLVGTAGCKREAAVPPVEPPTKPMASPSAQAPPLDPCALLADDSVARVVPGSGQGTRDTADEGYGTYTCRWSGGPEPVVLQVFSAGPGGLPHELRAASLEIVDIKRPDAGTLVRMERFDGIGDAAGAFVERADPARGIRRPYALLMVQRGNRLASLRIPSLATGDRAAALETLKGLAADLGKRL